jgi:hypothetical protein
MSPQIGMYLGYLAFSVVLTAWVGHTLYRNGEVFLAQVFLDHRMAESVNRLLVVGFYLINFGVVSVALRVASNARTGQQVIEQLSVKLGAVMLLLGVLHLVNLSVLTRIGQRSALGVLVPPAEDQVLPARY